MKSKLTLFLTSAFLLGVVACTKTSSVSPDPSPSTTLDGGTAVKLNGISKEFEINNSYDSILVINSNSTDTSAIKSLYNYVKLGNISSIPTNIDFTSFLLASPTSISEKTSYSIGGSNVKRLIIVTQLSGKRYIGYAPFPCTVSIDTLNPVFISGTYTATVGNTDQLSTSSLAGRFRANRW